MMAGSQWSPCQDTLWHQFLLCNIYTPGNGKGSRSLRGLITSFNATTGSRCRSPACVRIYQGEDAITVHRIQHLWHQKETLSWFHSSRKGFFLPVFNEFLRGLDSPEALPAPSVPLVEKGLCGILNNWSSGRGIAATQQNMLQPQPSFTISYLPAG